MRRLLLLCVLLAAGPAALAQQANPPAEAQPAQPPQAQPPQAQPPQTQAPQGQPSVRPPLVEREVKAQPGKAVRIAVFTRIKADCTPDQLPAVKLGEQPKHGQVVVRQVKVRLTNVRQCLALEVPGFVAFYQAKPDFPGKDVLTLEVREKDGRLQVQRITIVTGTPAGGDSI
jgi:hypothetical protein